MKKLAATIILSSILLWTSTSHGQSLTQQLNTKNNNNSNEQPQQRPSSQRQRLRRKNNQQRQERDLGIFDDATHASTEHLPPARHNPSSVSAPDEYSTSDSLPRQQQLPPSGPGGRTLCKSIMAIADTRLPLSENTETESLEEVDATSESSSSRQLTNRFFISNATEDEHGNSSSTSVVRDDDSAANANSTTDTGTSQEASVEHEHDGLDETFVCELHSGQTIPIQSTHGQLVDMRVALNEGLLVSAISTIGVAEQQEPEQDGEIDEGQEVGVIGAKPAHIIGAKPDASAQSPPTSSPTPTILESVTLPPGPIRFSTDPSNRRRLLQQHSKFQHLQDDENHPHQKLLNEQHDINLQARQTSSSSHGRRKLASYTGTKSMLVVKVTDSQNAAVPYTPSQISDKFFGTAGDDENMKSQFSSCSLGNLQISNTEYGSKSNAINAVLDAPGVLHVKISIDLNNPQHLLRSAIGSVVEAKLGFRLPGPFDNVLYVVKECRQACGWAAYAYVNSYLSVYQSRYFMYPAVQMHEIGHNLNFAHSGGKDGKTYTDHTCLMGNPLFSDTVGDMCFNPAKNYQIVNERNGNPGNGNWYSKNRVYTWTSSGNNKSWKGKLVGIAEYDKLSNGDQDSKVILKLETGTPDDLYLGFNRATGFNSDNVQADNEVTIVETGANGEGYSQSFLKSTLRKGQEYRVENWRRSGEALVVKVENINIGISPGYAEVSVKLGDGVVATPQPTPKPSPNSTPNPSPPPTQPSSPPPTNRPNPQPTLPPSPPPTNRPNPQPTPPPTLPPTPPPSLPPSPPPTPPPSPPPTPISPRPNPKPTPPPDSGAQSYEFSTTTITPNRVANGTMFTLRAFRDVSVKSLSTYTSAEVYNSIQVYTRLGDYSGHTSNSEGWTLIFDDYVQQRGIAELTKLGPFKGGQRIDIPAGGSASFYVYTTEKLSYQYQNDWVEGKAVTDDGSVQLLAGTAFAYGKWKNGCSPGVSPQPNSQCVFSPRVFSGLVEYERSVVATPQPTPPPVPKPTPNPIPSPTPKPNNPGAGGDSDRHEFVTTMFTPNKAAEGTMFTTQAFRDCSITSLSTYTVAKEYGNVQVYFRLGGYEGHTSSSEGWTLIFDKGVQLGGLVDLAKLGPFTQPVVIPAGGSVSFYVHTDKKLSYQYKDGWVEGKAVVDDGSLQMLAGTALAYGKWETGCAVSPRRNNQCVFSPRVFSGAIEYERPNSGSGGGVVEEDFEFDSRITTPNKAAEGSMFTVQAMTDDVSVKSMSTHTATNSYGPVQVYTRPGLYVGHTGSSEGWTLIYDSSVQQRGFAGLTDLGTFIDNYSVDIAKGESASFYVYTENKLAYQYRSNWNEGEFVLDDGNLKLFAGVALAYGKWEQGCAVSPQPNKQCLFSPRVFSGLLGYSMKSSDAETGEKVDQDDEGGSSLATTTTSTAMVTSTTTSTMSSSASIIQFSTPNQDNAKSSTRGLMFTLEAKQNILIHGLKLVANKNAPLDLSIYARSGSYEGKPLNENDWNLIYRDNPNGRSERLVDLGDFNENVPVKAGENVSFYIFSKKGFMITPGDNEGMEYGRDDAIAVRQGRQTRSLFRRPTVTGMWAGVVRYSIEGVGNEGTSGEDTDNGGLLP